jgi:hypothetical protein
MSEYPMGVKPISLRQLAAELGWPEPDGSMLVDVMVALLRVGPMPLQDLDLRLEGVFGSGDLARECITHGLYMGRVLMSSDRIVSLPTEADDA